MPRRGGPGVGWARAAELVRGVAVLGVEAPPGSTSEMRHVLALAVRKA